MDALVTGGAGFIGSHVAEHLLKMGHDVVVLDDLSGGNVDNVPRGAKFIQGDICDVRLVEKIFAEQKFAVVFHLAAYAAEGLSHFIRRYNYTNNLVGSVTLLNAAINNDVRRFVFTSSIAVYGANQLPMTEDLIPSPEDPYGIAKLAVEQDLRSAFEMFGLEYVIFRPHNVYGERQNIGDSYRNVVGIFMNRLLQGLSLPIFGDGSQTRAFSYIGDVAPIIARGGYEPGARNEIFNVGADQPVSVRDLAEEVCRVFGCESRLEYLPARHEVLHAFSSHEKVRKVFGDTTSVPLREGITRMAAWIREVGPRQSSRFEAIEVFRNLPPSWAAYCRQE